MSLDYDYVPLKGGPSDPTYGSLKRDLIERDYIPKGPLILTPNDSELMDLCFVRILFYEC